MKLLSHPAIRQSLGLVSGLAIGIIGAVLFQQSLPPAEGSVEQRLEEVEKELRIEQQKVKALEADGKVLRSRRTPRDEMRFIAERIKRGEDISLDDVFRVMKPALRDLAPLLDRIREVEQENRFDAISGEFARKYGLSEQMREDLRQWLIAKGEENTQEFMNVIHSETSGFVDFIRVNRFDEDDVEGLDTFMESRLEGESREEFMADRLEERITSVEAEADRRLQRLGDVVGGLEDDQVDDMFVGARARGSKKYQDGMEIGVEGADTSRLRAGRSRPGHSRGPSG